jgi:tRNA dimethylallyltransferase
MQSVGYKETIQYLNGELQKEELAEAITISTRQLAKRQKTWFKRDKSIHWFDGATGFDQAWKLVENFLNPFDPSPPQV